MKTKQNFYKLNAKLSIFFALVKPHGKRERWVVKMSNDAGDVYVYVFLNVFWEIIIEHFVRWMPHPIEEHQTIRYYDNDDVCWIWMLWSWIEYSWVSPFENFELKWRLNDNGFVVHSVNLYSRRFQIMP